MESYSCVEYVHVQNLKRIIKSSKFDEGQMNLLKSLYRSVKDSGKHQIEFLPKDKVCKTKAIGRLYPKFSKASLQGVKREVRKALAHHRYTDCDIKNCHPVLMDQIFQKEKISCPALSKYVTERESFLKVAPKQVWTMMLNNGHPRSGATDLERRFWIEVIEAATHS